MEIINSEIMKLKQERAAFQEELRISSVATVTRMKNILNLSTKRESIESLLENTKAYKQAEETKKAYDAQLKEKRIGLSREIISEINASMRDMNDMITAPSHTNPPELTLTENGKNYVFQTPKD